MPGDITPYQFKPGQSGNPGGRPKRLPVTDYLRSQLDKPIPESMRGSLPKVFTEVYGNEPTFGQMVAFQVIAMAAQGDVAATKELMERVEGKVPGRQVIAGDDENPLTIKSILVPERIATKPSAEPKPEFGE